MQPNSSEPDRSEIVAPPEDLPADELDATTAEVLRFWLQKAAHGQPPSRRDLDPASLRRVLPWIVLWDVEPEGYRCRLAGTKVCEQFGTELRGLSLDQILQSNSSSIRHDYDLVRDKHLAHHVARSLPWSGMTHRRYRRLLLPLVDETGRVETLLGVVTFEPHRA